MKSRWKLGNYHFPNLSFTVFIWNLQYSVYDETFLCDTQNESVIYSHQKCLLFLQNHLLLGGMLGQHEYLDWIVILIWDKEDDSQIYITF